MDRPLNQSSFKEFMKTYNDKNKPIDELYGVLNPISFYNSFYGKVDKEDDVALRRGTLIDTELTGTEEEKKAYRTVDFDVPQSKNQIEFCDRISKLEKPPTEEDIKEIYDDIYTIKKKDPYAYDMYFKYLTYIQAKKKEPDISFIPKWQDYSKKAQIKAIKDNKTARKLMLDEHISELVGDGNTNFVVLNQLKIVMPWEGLPKGVIGTLDRIIIDFENKKVYLIDLKTSGGYEKFADKFIKYGYYIQLPFYYKLLQYYLDQKGYKNLDITCYFVCVNSTKPYISYVPLDYTKPEWLKLGEKGGLIYNTDRSSMVTSSHYVRGYVELINNVKWNEENNCWDKTKDESEGFVDLNVKCIPND